MVFWYIKEIIDVIWCYGNCFVFFFDDFGDCFMGYFGDFMFKVLNVCFVCVGLDDCG